MNIGLTRINFKKLKTLIDWKLLVLLLFFLDVKMAIKVPAIVLVYVLQPNFNFGFKLKNPRLPLFYPFISVLAIVAMVINKSYQNSNYFLVLFTGIGFWLLCVLAIHQVKLTVEQQQPKVIHQTIVVFFIINALFSALNLFKIIWEIGEINPYIYQGLFQKYFMGTGDYIKGVTFDTSTTNAILNTVGVIYFLIKKQYPMLILCMVVLIFTASNFSNIMLIGILTVLFVFKSSRDQKSMIVICLFLLVVFMVKISPQNNKYVNETFERVFDKNWDEKLSNVQTKPIPLREKPDSILTQEEKREKFVTLYLDSLNLLQNPIKVSLAKNNKTLIKDEHGRILLPQDSIHTPTFQSIKVPLKIQEPMLLFIEKNSASLPYSSKRTPIPSFPGKAVGLLQSVHFFISHPSKIIVGNGMGNFSSKLAFRTTNLGITGNYPKKYAYINEDFLVNHLDIYLYFFSKQSGYHSITNSPFSGYDQLLSEYGIIGLLLFFIFYIGYFLKDFRKLTYGIPLLCLLLGIFFIDYWFEQLSVLILFELMLLLNIKESSLQATGGLANE
ncbi:hypothetical protein GM921_04125 [Pedobacter sp. LMG 31464]|uniref:Uncharacterized protein n=1 Tax=Pedobacter planticolens TaxID=2679964 RepID=A0A923DX39_9SPHI|nr:hypothetical protein [Pedobacter planticolens]MBB2144656.1 hypothetical protein [Pedobacter planticolens]